MASSLRQRFPKFLFLDYTWLHGDLKATIDVLADKNKNGETPSLRSDP